MRANTTIGPKRPKVKVVSGAAGLIVVGLVLAACSSAAGAAKTTTAKAQPSQYRQATYAAAAKVSDWDQLRLEHQERIRLERQVILPPKVSDLEQLRLEHRETLRLRSLAR